MEPGEVCGVCDGGHIEERHNRVLSGAISPLERVATAQAMRKYMAEEARAADLPHDDPGDSMDFSCSGTDTDYPGGPLVIERSGAREAVCQALAQEASEDDFNYFLTEVDEDCTAVVRHPLLLDAMVKLSRAWEGETLPPAPDLSAITRDIARGG